MCHVIQRRNTNAPSATPAPNAISTLLYGLALMAASVSCRAFSHAPLACATTADDDATDELKVGTVRYFKDIERSNLTVKGVIAPVIGENT